MAQITFGVSPMICLALGFGFVASVMAFDMTLNTNLAVYWGQNSLGATNPGDKASWQQPIEFYCGDDTIDTLPIAFLNEFYSTGGKPAIDLANVCSSTDNPVFPGTNLANCAFLESGIETCQKAGKIVTISVGGATGGVTFAGDSAGEAYAQVIWDLFLGGDSPTRPFGKAVLDGIDMDIEGGSQAGYVAFLTALRKLMDGGNKKYYITAAPQCPFPDAYIGTTLSAFGFDAVYVQFYNNFCSVGSGNAFNFGAWDNWAKNTSPNKNVKVYIGAPASSSAAGSGYVAASELATVVSQVKGQYSSFGGVMLWDASQASGNGKFDQAIKSALTGSSGAPPTSPSSSPSSQSASSLPSAPPLGSAPSSQSASSMPSAPPLGSASFSQYASSMPSAPPYASAPSSQSASSMPSAPPYASASLSQYASSMPSAPPLASASSSPSASSLASPSSLGSPAFLASPSPTGTPTDSPMSPSATPSFITSYIKTTTATATSSSPSATSIASAGCADAHTFESNLIYLGGDEAVYNNQLWKAQWWTEGSTPGSPEGVWTLVGSC